MALEENGRQAQAGSCLLCGRENPRQIKHLTGAQLRLLWERIHHEFTADAWGGITPGHPVEMRQCGGCGFVFFDPELAGGEAFYRQLEREGYYSPTNPEFARTNEFAKRRGLRRVLDVGCGSGFYLDLARASALEACGLELNNAAAEKARAKGHKILNRLLHELDREEVGGFDLITLFQVLEHVPDPVSIMQQAAGFLNPGGYIAVAVPSADGVYRLCPWDPHQWPPHHISHWRLADFEQLATTSGLKLAGCGGDILVGSLIENLWRLHNQLATVVGQPPRFGGDTLPRLVSLLYRKTGMKHVFPHWGSSIYGYFQRH